MSADRCREKETRGGEDESKVDFRNGDCSVIYIESARRESKRGAREMLKLVCGSSGGGSVVHVNQVHQ